MRKLKNSQGGFNLIELMVVMAIIAILVGILIYTINAARMQQRNTQRRGMMDTTKSALEAFYAKYKTYPPTPAGGLVSTLLQTNSVAGGTGGVRDFATGVTADVWQDPAGNDTRNCYARVSKSQYNLYTVTEPTVAPGACAAAVPANAEDFSVQ